MSSHWMVSISLLSWPVWMGWPLVVRGDGGRTARPTPTAGDRGEKTQRRHQETSGGAALNSVD